LINNEHVTNLVMISQLMWRKKESLKKETTAAKHKAGTAVGQLSRWVV